MPGKKPTKQSKSQEQAAVWMNPKELKPWANNPRSNDHAVPAVMASIEKLGFGAPLVARRANRELISGHTRLKAALQLGLDRVPVRLLDISESDAHLMALADNKLAEMSDWTADLAGIFGNYDAEALSLAGFNADEIAKWADNEIKAGKTGEVDLVEFEVGKKPITCPRCKFEFSQ